MEQLAGRLVLKVNARIHYSALTYILLSLGPLGFEPLDPADSLAYVIKNVGELTRTFQEAKWNLDVLRFLKACTGKI